MSFDPTDSGTVMVDCVPIRRRLSRSGADGTSSIRLTATMWPASTCDSSHGRCSRASSASGRGTGAWMSSRDHRCVQVKRSPCGSHSQLRSTSSSPHSCRWLSTMRSSRSPMSTAAKRAAMSATARSKALRSSSSRAM